MLLLVRTRRQLLLPLLLLAVTVCCFIELVVQFPAPLFLTGERRGAPEVDWTTCPVQNLTDMHAIFDYVDIPTLSCQQPVYFGGATKKVYVDGRKFLCMDSKFNITKNSCVVYSFGINNQWAFDDEVDKKLGCKVFAFDMTMKTKSHKRSPNIEFFLLGISNATNTTKKVDRYVNIVRMLGHEDTTIDYLKMDVEGAEGEFFQDVLTNVPHLLLNVKMIAMEVHYWPHRNRKVFDQFWEYYQKLECLGFRVMHSEKNPLGMKSVWAGETRTCCYEVVWARDRQW